MAHLTALAAARHALLARQGWDVERRGLFGAPAVHILGSNQRHGSIERAARMLGIGRDQLVDLPVNARGQLDPAALQDALQARRGQPVIVVLQAGDLNIGAYDAFETLIPMARAQGAWIHVDGAFGLWAAASARLRPLLAGHAGADSWAADGHKWLNVPFDSGFVFVADAAAHRGAMSYRASYAQATDEARDQIDWNPEWSRRGRAVSTYAAIRQLGRQGIAALVDRCCDHARALVHGIGRWPGARIMWEPVINQGLLRFLSPHPGAGEAEHDAATDAVIAAVNAGGEAFFSGTTWNGLRCMRVSVVNWQTSASDVERAVAAVGQAMLSLRRGAAGSCRRADS
jgi:glutamate/tyrosine decarboxylase-like PLP-dependent enzyme